MKRLINTNSVICFVLLAAFGLASCDNNSTSAPDPIDPGNYPTATFTTDHQGSTISEGDTLMYQVVTDKPLESPVTIELSISGDSSFTDADYQYDPVTIPAFSQDTVNIPIIFPIDDIPENSEDLSFSFEVTDPGTKYSLNPDTQYPSNSLTLENTNDPNALTVAMSWENHDTDMDVWLNLLDDGTYAGLGFDGDGDGLIYWGDAATGNIPEILKIPTNDISANGSTGEYYVEVDPWTVDTNPVNYKFSVGYPDGTVEFYEGTFDNTDLGSYIQDMINSDYDATNDFPVYRMLYVVLTAGGDFTVTSTN